MKNNDRNRELPVTADEVRAFRLRAREIVNLVLEMTDQISDPHATPREQADCMARLSSIYAKAIGVPATQVARMTLLDAIAMVNARPRISNEAEARAYVERIYGEMKKPAPESTLRHESLHAMVVDEEPGGRRDVQEVWWYFERSFPDRIVALRQATTTRLLTAAIKSFARGERRSRMPGENYKWTPIVELMNAADLGPIAESTLPVEWSKWNHATQARAETIQKKRRGRPPNAH